MTSGALQGKMVNSCKMVSLTNIQQNILEFKGNSPSKKRFVNYDNIYVNALMLTNNRSREYDFIVGFFKQDVVMTKCTKHNISKCRKTCAHIQTGKQNLPAW